MDAQAENMVIAKLETLEKKMDTILLHGCAKSADYEQMRDDQRELFKRVKDVELAQAEGKGKLAVFAVLVGAVLTFAMQWLGKHI